MFLVRTYYQVKPFVPHSFRLAFRRWRAERRRRAFASTWPVNPAAAVKPPGWTGWPDGKKFALVLTHDVERAHGLDQSRAVADLETSRGFRSAFNFVPEGDYRVPAAFRQFLAQNGFEVGVHDLKHDGKLYWSRAAFRRQAQSINGYLRDWNAVGFRSGFMHHNLDWLHELDVLYDSSTFDTDPFEPQPDGVHTIFPFWVAAPASGSQPSTLHSQLSTESGSRPSTLNPQLSTNRGYIELPYTLPQDFTLFLLLQEKTIDIWKRKLDWVAEHGGMAMIDTHPDYVDITGPGQPGVSYPLKFYAEFLDYARQKYGGQFWSALPREVARFAKEQIVLEPSDPALNPQPSTTDVPSFGALPSVLRPQLSTLNPQLRVPSVLRPPSSSVAPRRKKIWIDLDNTPHVPFFEPIVAELSARGFDVVLTARDAFQVCELAEQRGFHYQKIGRHHGRNKFFKVIGLFHRALQLAPFALREKPDLALSHGARSQIIICNLLRIPTVLMADYEFAQYPPLMRPTWEMVPEVIPNESLCCRPDHIRKYPGIKEDVYVNRMLVDPRFLDSLGLSGDRLIVTVRPPATEAHYHNPESEKLFVRFMERASRNDDVRIVLLPRNSRQGEEIRQNWPQWFANGWTVIPRSAIDGLNLLWHSDLVVSGGGTMNREAAALGVPVYSIFRGRIGAIDHHLEKEGRLIMVETPEEVDQKIQLTRRHRNGHLDNSRRSLSVVVDHIQQIAENHCA
jgi:predicted glycosyltransferase